MLPEVGDVRGSAHAPPDSTVRSPYRPLTVRSQVRSQLVRVDEAVDLAALRVFEVAQPALKAELACGTMLVSRDVSAPQRIFSPKMSGNIKRLAFDPSAAV
jgi:hypothetical protein